MNYNFIGQSIMRSICRSMFTEAIKYLKYIEVNKNLFFTIKNRFGLMMYVKVIDHQMVIVIPDAENNFSRWSVQYNPPHLLEHYLFHKSAYKAFYHSKESLDLLIYMFADIIDDIVIVADGIGGIVAQICAFFILENMKIHHLPTLFLFDTFHSIGDPILAYFTSNNVFIYTYNIYSLFNFFKTRLYPLICVRIILKDDKHSRSLAKIDRYEYLLKKYI